MELNNVEVVNELKVEGSEYSVYSVILRIQLEFCASSEWSKCLIIDKIWRHWQAGRCYISDEVLAMLTNTATDDLLSCYKNRICSCCDLS